MRDVSSLAQVPIFLLNEAELIFVLPSPSLWVVFMWKCCHSVMLLNAPCMSLTTPISHMDGLECRLVFRCKVFLQYKALVYFLIYRKCTLWRDPVVHKGNERCRAARFTCVRMHGCFESSGLQSQSRDLRTFDLQTLGMFGGVHEAPGAIINRTVLGKHTKNTTGGVLSKGHHRGSLCTRTALEVAPGGKPD